MIITHTFEDRYYDSCIFTNIEFLFAQSAEDAFPLTKAYVNNKHNEKVT